MGGNELLKNKQPKKKSKSIHPSPVPLMEKTFLNPTKVTSWEFYFGHDAWLDKNMDLSSYRYSPIEVFIPHTNIPSFKNKKAAVLAVLWFFQAILESTSNIGGPRWTRGNDLSCDRGGGDIGSPRIVIVY